MLSQHHAEESHAQAIAAAARAAKKNDIVGDISDDEFGAFANASEDEPSCDARRNNNASDSIALSCTKRKARSLSIDSLDSLDPVSTQPPALRLKRESSIAFFEN